MAAYIQNLEGDSYFVIVNAVNFGDLKSASLLGILPNQAMPKSTKTYCAYYKKVEELYNIVLKRSNDDLLTETLSKQHDELQAITEGKYKSAQTDDEEYEFLFANIVYLADKDFYLRRIFRSNLTAVYSANLFKHRDGGLLDDSW